MKYFIPTLLLLFSVFNSYAQEEAMEKYKEATELMKSQKYEEAIAAFTEAISLTDDLEFYRYVYIYRSQCYSAIRQFDEALADINKAIEIDSSDLKSFYDRMMVYKRMANWELILVDAEFLLSQKITKEEVAQTHFFKGVAHFGKDEPKEALASFKIARKRLTGDAELVFYMGQTHESMKDYEKAIELYTEVIALSPNWSLGYYSRGNARIQKYRAENNDVVINVMVKDACADFSKALELGFRGPTQLIDLYCN